MLDLKQKKILITGGNGFLGSYLVENLTKKRKVSQDNIFIPRSSELDLREWKSCQKAVQGQQVVFHLAAFVGGIGFNREHPGRMFYDNMIMGAQMMEAARQEGVEKFITVGSVCSYPKYTPVPFKEDDLWNGYPEETNAPYGLAKKALLVQSQAYREQYGMNTIYLLEVNLYGPRDNFDPQSSHVIPALIKKVADAQDGGLDYVELWGTGRASREFMYAEDSAEGIVRAAEKYNGAEPVNLGAGREITIKKLISIIADTMKFNGEIRWDHSQPDGQPRRMLDTTRAKEYFDFESKTDFEEGLKKTIDWYEAHRVNTK